MKTIPLSNDPTIATATPEELERWRTVQTRAKFEWSQARPAPRSLLNQCGLPSRFTSELRMMAGAHYLLLPMCDYKGDLWSLQYIPQGFRPCRKDPKAADTMRNMLNPRERGLYFLVGRVRESDAHGGIIAITEFLHDAVTWKEETRGPCFAALTPGNIRPMAEMLRAAYPDARIVIWARWEEQLEQAKRAAEVNGVCYVEDPDDLLSFAIESKRGAL